MTQHDDTPSYPTQPGQTPATPVQPYGSPQYGTPSGSPQYGAPQYGAPQYGAPQPGAPQYGSPQYGGQQYGTPSLAPVERPATLRNAVRLMLAGAAMTVIGLLFNLLTFGSQMAQTTAKLSRTPNMTPELISTANTVALVAVIVGAVISVALWLWMAWKNNQGRKWARIVATVMAGVSVVSVPLSWVQSAANGMNNGAGQFIISALTLVIGISAAVLMWRRPSSEYYAYVSQQKQLQRSQGFTG